MWWWSSHLVVVDILWQYGRSPPGSSVHGIIPARRLEWVAISSSYSWFILVETSSHEIKRRLLLGRKVMTNLDSILKSWDITLSTNVCLVKAMVFLVVMDGCESWTIKKAKCRRIDAFKLWCWIRLLRVPWTARRSNPSILKEISPEFIGGTNVEAETPILWPPDAESWLIWKDPDAGKDWGQEEKGTTEDEMIRRHHQLNGHGFG